MIINYSDLKKYVPDLNWPISKAAAKLSDIGHEAEVVEDDKLDLTFTANRHDCKDVKYLAFDLAGVYNLKTTENLIEIKTGQEIAVTIDQINRILGSRISFTDLKQLERLGFSVSETSVTPPAFRDVATISDVAEEMVRIIGYDQLKIALLSQEEPISSPTYSHLLAIKTALAEAGLTETATSSFSAKGAVSLKNPYTTDEPYLRSTLLTGLLRTLAKNPYLKRAAFFEVGEVFEPSEITKVGIIVAGYKHMSDWQTEITAALGTTTELKPVDSNLALAEDAKQGQIYFAEVKTSQIKPKSVILPNQPLAKYQPISKFPPLVRDITVSNAAKPGEEIIKLTQEKFGPQLLIMEQIDQYNQSLTFRLLFQKTESSFTQAEIDQLTNTAETFLKPFSQDR